MNKKLIKSWMVKTPRHGEVFLRKSPSLRQINENSSSCAFFTLNHHLSSVGVKAHRDAPQYIENHHPIPSMKFWVDLCSVSHFVKLIKTPHAFGTIIVNIGHEINTYFFEWYGCFCAKGPTRKVSLGN